MRKWASTVVKRIVGFLSRTALRNQACNVGPWTIGTSMPRHTQSLLFMGPRALLCTPGVEMMLILPGTSCARRLFPHSRCDAGGAGQVVIRTCDT